MNLHSLIVRNAGKPILIWLHGVGGTAALSFLHSNIIEKLADDFEIHALDLPGFGRSTCPPVFGKVSDAEIETFFVDVLYQYAKSQNLSRFHLSAHSFGAQHHAIKFATRYPSMVESLILANPAGLFSTAGKEGMYISLLFKCGIPMFPLRCLGRFGSWIYHIFGAILGFTPLNYYWYQVQASPEGITMTNVVWTRPSCRDVLGLSIPVSFIYGETDNITPLHQGVVISALSGNQIPVYVVKGAWHMPMAVRNWLDFSTILRICIRSPYEKETFLMRAFNI